MLILCIVLKKAFQAPMTLISSHQGSERLKMKCHAAGSLELSDVISTLRTKITAMPSRATIPPSILQLWAHHPTAHASGVGESVSNVWLPATMSESAKVFSVACIALIMAIGLIFVWGEKPALNGQPSPQNSRGTPLNPLSAAKVSPRSSLRLPQPVNPLPPLGLMPTQSQLTQLALLNPLHICTRQTTLLPQANSVTTSVSSLTQSSKITYL